MDVGKFFEIWETTTIALSEAEKGRLLSALIANTHKDKNGNSNTHGIMTGREKLVYPYFSRILEEATKERIV